MNARMSAQREYAELPRPYKGPHHYRMWDKPLFFGREPDIRAVKEMASLNRLCYLHAPSGAGKTSILRCAVGPAMEENDYFYIYIRPGEDPDNELRRKTLECIIPAPEAELKFLEKFHSAWERSSQKTRVNGCTLSELRSWFTALKVYDPIRAELFSKNDHGQNIEESTDYGSNSGLNPTHNYNDADSSLFVRSLFLRNGQRRLCEYIVRLLKITDKPIDEDDTKPFLSRSDQSQIDVKRLLEILNDKNIQKAHVEAYLELWCRESCLSMFFNNLANKFQEKRWQPSFSNSRPTHIVR